MRRLRMASGMTGTRVAAHLLISQPKVSHMETGRRAVSPRDVRDLCKPYGVTDQNVVDSLTELRQRVEPTGLVARLRRHSHSVHIDLETEAASIHTYQSVVIPLCCRLPPTRPRS
ncbi:helix-turn-helix domain-containing protein [Streptomyces sp. NPDC088553]|uniref:helix-turn-helix domain-containing protein n=1 Tax=Streptomyces sp. NPDC088553 TaxID=3365864 RepID=UPI00382278A9